MHYLAGALLLQLALGIAACGGSEIYSFMNEGMVCLASNSDGTLDAAVVFPTCLSSTCDTVLGTSCAIGVADSEIVMESSGSYASPKRGDCSADCKPLIAYCTSPEPVPPGEYAVVHGEDRGAVTVPTPATTLFGSERFPPCDWVLNREEADQAGRP
jgi:hypothetical protein